MTTAPPNDYGHAGEAQYNVDHSEWLFTRRLGYNRRLQLFEGPTVTLKSHSAPGISHIPRSARARNHSIRDLTSVFPEVAAAANYLPLQARDSEHVEELYGLHDPHESELLAFGHATETDDSYSHPKRVHVVAIPGGPSKDNLIIVRLNRETFEWQGHEKLRLSSTTLRSGERSMLQSGRGPIRQLRFSPATLGGRAWLAVRFNTETILLQPVFRRNDGLSKPRLPIPSSMVDRRSSRSDSDHSLVLSMHRTGGSSHSDVAFNPFIGNEFAVLDQQGCWSIWKLERQGQRRVGWRMRRVISGHVDSLHTSGKNVTDTLEDGWGRVNWVGDSKTIYVVSRTSLAILGLSNGTGQLPTPSLITAGSTESIIDAKEDPLNTSRFYVVTSTQIFCLEVPSYSDPGHEKFRERARVVICWRHFRDYQDISLRISICRATESIATLVILYSNLTRLTTVHTLHGTPSVPMGFLTVSAPHVLAFEKPTKEHAPQPELMEGNRKAVTALILRALHHALEENSASTRSGPGADEMRTMFYQLIALDGDLNVCEYLYTDHPELLPGPPTDRSLIVSLKSSAKVALEHFVVRTASEDEDQGEPILTSTQDKSEDAQQSSANIKEIRNLNQDQWSLNSVWLQHHLKNVPEVEKREFDSTLQVLRPVVDGAPSGLRYVSKSLLELLELDASLSSIVVIDVDAASSSLEECLQNTNPAAVSHEDSENNQHQSSVSDAPMKSFCHNLGTEDELQLSQLYDRVVRLWISPLPLHSPGRVRIVNEKVARMMAAQLCLACFRVDPSSPVTINSFSEDTAQCQSQLEFQHRSRTLAMEQSGQSTQVLPTSAETHGSIGAAQFLPTPEPTPSVRSRSSMSSISASESLASHIIRSRVPHLKPQIFSDSISSNIMLHWGEGMDPLVYDWETMERTVAIDDEAAEVDESSQRRRKHREEKQRKRLREREDGHSTQPAPREVKSSQPQESLGTQESIFATEPIVMSQVEPGLHGGRRSLAKNRLQRRKAGF